MSEADKTTREWKFYLEDMRRFAEKVISYTNGLEQEGFVASELTYDATLRNLELIGEAATHIPESVRDQYHQIPWRMIIATRNRIIHAYLGIDNDIIWNIIKEHIPELLAELSKIPKNRIEQ